MMLIETLPPPAVSRAPGHVIGRQPGSTARARVVRHSQSRRRPVGARPHGAALRYRPVVAEAPRRCEAPRRVGLGITIGLAALSGLITVWLGIIAHLGALAASATDDPSAAVPEQFAVVRVGAGESLAQLARRIAPDAPVGEVIARIRDLNRLDVAGVQAGQVLIAPMQ